MPHRHLIVVPHTHWDREWYRTHEQFRYQLIGLLDGLLDLLEGDAEFEHFTLDGQVVVLDDYLEVRPNARGRIEKLIRAGRLLIGPWYVLPDEWLVSGEALIRNLRLGIRRAAPLGGSMRLGYVPDQFGHVGQMPQIFAGFGFEAAVLWRGVGEGVDRAVFDWEAPDGTRMLTVYMKRGYGNASNLPLAPEALASRLQREVESQESSRVGRSLLLMNGSDHLEPQPGLPSALREATSGLDVSFEIGTLPRFVERVRNECDRELQLHSGELRSGLRSPLLEGCASARITQKRRDFLNDALLTRYVEPLGAWLQALGGDPDCEMLDFIWRVAIENHPHDSICGCSIDAVHDEMDTRFARVEEMANAHLSRLQCKLAGHVRALPQGTTNGLPIAVWNPGASGVGLVDGTIEFDVPDRSTRLGLVARNAAGERIPVHAQRIRAGEILAEYTLPAGVIRAIVDGFPPEFMGLSVVELRWRHRGKRSATRSAATGSDPAAVGLEVTVFFGETAADDFDFGAAKQAFAEVLEAEGDGTVRFRARRRPLLRIRFADTLPGCGLRTYRIERPRQPLESPLHAATTSDGGAVIANETWRIELDPSGRVDFYDRRSGTRISDALRFVDAGDRGDEYTFDPVADDVGVTEPESTSVRLVPRSAAEVAVAIRLSYRVPREVVPDRTRRSKRDVALPVTLTLRLACGLDRIDIAVDATNTARDHRLRLELRAPFAAERFEVESAFEVAERPIAPPAGHFGRERPAEFPTGSTPHRTFATLVAGERALTVANRGSPEVEALPDGDSSWLALTLVRAVGWLSRDDLEMRPGHAGPALSTPGAQSLGRLRAEFSYRLHAAGDPTRTAHAHRFAYPPIAFPAGRDDGEIEDGDRLVEVDDPFIVVSAIEPAPDGSAQLRLVNLSADARMPKLLWNAPGPSRLVETNLLGQPDRIKYAAAAEMRPWQIRSLRAESCG